MSIAESATAALVVLFAYLVRGVSGFGSALIAVPLLVQLLPITLVVPLIAVLDLFAAAGLTGSGWRDRRVHWDEVTWLLPGSLIGVALGLHLLVAMDPRWLMGALGMLVVAFGLRSLLGLHGERRIARLWALPAGTVGGCISAMFAAGGPPFVIYLSHRLHDRQALRATLSAVFMLDGGIRVVGMLLAGLLWQPRIGWYLLAGLPLMVAGLYLGNRLHLGLSPRRMTAVVGALLVAAGMSLWLRVLGDG